MNLHESFDRAKEEEAEKWRKEFESAQQKSCVVCFKNTNVCQCDPGKLSALWHEWTGV